MNISVANYFNSNINYIEQQLLSKPITSQTHNALIDRLDELGHVISCETKHQNLFANSYFKEMQEHVIDLYGKVESGLWSYKLQQIHREASLLNNYPCTGNVKRVEKVAQGLQDHLDILVENYAPALQEKKVLSFARTVLSRLSDPQLPSIPLEENGDSHIDEEIEDQLQLMIDCFTQNDLKRARFFL